jgi:hypothetical protein
MALIYHVGGPRDGDVGEVADHLLATSVLVYDGPRWYGVYAPADPPRRVATPQGDAEVWRVLEY